MNINFNEPLTSQENWDQIMAALDAKRAQGHSITSTRNPLTGTYHEANSAEDAFFISRGRPDLATSN